MIRTISLVLVAILFAFLLLTPFFIKVKVQCASQFGSCPNDISAELEKFGGENLFQARRQSLQYLRRDLMVSDFSSQFKLPDLLVVSVLIKKPEFAILDKSSGSVGLVDKNGTIVSILPNSLLPTVTVVSKSLKIGEKVDTGELFSLELMQGIWQMYQIGSGDIQDSSLVVELPGPVKVILPQEGDKDLLLGEVRLIYGKVESMDAAGKYSEIDLRYKNPVLR